jgi:hypothetical protein
MGTNIRNYEEVEISFGGINLTVSGKYIPEEPEVRYYADMSGYPGSGSDFEIDSIQINGTEINELLSEEQFEEVKDKVIEYLES